MIMKDDHPINLRFSLKIINEIDSWTRHTLSFILEISKTKANERCEFVLMGRSPKYEVNNGITLYTAIKRNLFAKYNVQ